MRDGNGIALGQKVPIPTPGTGQDPLEPRELPPVIEAMPPRVLAPGPPPVRGPQGLPPRPPTPQLVDAPPDTEWGVTVLRLFEERCAWMMQRIKDLQEVEDIISSGLPRPGGIAPLEEWAEFLEAEIEPALQDVEEYADELEKLGCEVDRAGCRITFCPWRPAKSLFRFYPDPGSVGEF